MQIRQAAIDDAETIARIYNHEVLTSTATFDLVPRSLREQQEWIRQRSGAHVALVCEDHGGIVGFGSLSPYRERPGYSPTVEDSVYVAPDHQRKGVGRALLTALVEGAEARGFHSVVARIADGHEASIALHAGVGFEVVGTEREIGRKLGRWLDVVIMQRMI